MSLARKTIRYLDRSCRVSLAGKTVLITGAGSGIGYKTAEIMLYLGASVIMACRNLPKAENARRQLLADYPGSDIRIMPLDLADFRSIDSFAANLPDADVFINNAGVFHLPGKKTADGFPMVMGVNYLGVYRLSEKALPLLRERGRETVWINTVSFVHRLAKVDFSRFFDDRGSYPRSKLCLARYTRFLADRYRGTNIRVYQIHPGIALTPIAGHVFPRLYRLAPLSPFNSPEKSSLSPAWILSRQVPEGSLVGPKGFLNIWGYPGINRPCRRAGKEIEPLIRFTESLAAEPCRGADNPAPTAGSGANEAPPI